MIKIYIIFFPSCLNYFLYNLYKLTRYYIIRRKRTYSLKKDNKKNKKKKQGELLGTIKKDMKRMCDKKINRNKKKICFSDYNFTTFSKFH